jgi:hypothetical protein
MGELNKEGARWMEQHKLQGLLRGILSAIAYCHDRRIIHRLSLVIAPVHAAMSRFTLTPAHAKPDARPVQQCSCLYLITCSACVQNTHMNAF